MRIISGTVGGRKLTEPVGNKIRPTSDRVKESIFNILQFDIEGRRVLDLFAGTGQLGIEALSRGAASAVFVDSSSDAVKLVRDNLRICGLYELARVYLSDALRFLESDERFDIILVDPPYDSMLTHKVVSKIIEFDKLNVNGIILCEFRAATAIPEVKPPYELVKSYKYGTVCLTKIARSFDTAML